MFSNSTGLFVTQNVCIQIPYYIACTPVAPAVRLAISNLNQSQNSRRKLETFQTVRRHCICVCADLGFIS